MIQEHIVPCKVKWNLHQLLMLSSISLSIKELHLLSAIQCLSG